MRYGRGVALLAMGLVSACQRIDPGVTGTGGPLDFGNLPPLPDGGIPISLGTPPILLPDGTTTTEPCVAVKTESMAIREKFCAGCHGPGKSQGQPLFDFVLDDEKLMATTYPQSGLLFIAPGDPGHSEVYQRVSLGLMPPSASDIANQASARPTTSDISVLREWIMCLGPGGTVQSSGGAVGTGGSGGNGNSVGGDNGNGGGGMAGQGGENGDGGMTGSGGTAGESGATGGGGGKIGSGGTVGQGGNGDGSGGNSDGSGGALGSSGGGVRGGGLAGGGVNSTGGLASSGGVLAFAGRTGTGPAGGSGGGGNGAGAPDAQPLANLLSNGDFANGETHWHVTVNNGVGISHAVNRGQFCVSLPANAAATVGYPVELALAVPMAAGATYDFSYQVSSTSLAVNFEAKVGQAVTPFASAVDYMGETVGLNVLRTNTHVFAANTSEDECGVAITVTTGASPSTVCIDNVSLSVR
jgi:hypothetical protein